jgi:hypothetical protein
VPREDVVDDFVVVLRASAQKLQLLSLPRRMSGRLRAQQVAQHRHCDGRERTSAVTNNSAERRGRSFPHREANGFA